MQHNACCLWIPYHTTTTKIKFIHTALDMLRCRQSCMHFMYTVLRTRRRAESCETWGSPSTFEVKVCLLAAACFKERKEKQKGSSSWWWYYDMMPMVSGLLKVVHKIDETNESEVHPDLFVIFIVLTSLFQIQLYECMYVRTY